MLKRLGRDEGVAQVFCSGSQAAVAGDQPAAGMLVRRGLLQFGDQLVVGILVFGLSWCERFDDVAVPLDGFDGVDAVVDQFESLDSGQVSLALLFELTASRGQVDAFVAVFVEQHVVGVHKYLQVCGGGLSYVSGDAENFSWRLGGGGLVFRFVFFGQCGDALMVNAAAGFAFLFRDDAEFTHPGRSKHGANGRALEGVQDGVECFFCMFVRGDGLNLVEKGAGRFGCVVPIRAEGFLDGIQVLGQQCPGAREFGVRRQAVGGGFLEALQADSGLVELFAERCAGAVFLIEAGLFFEKLVGLVDQGVVGERFLGGCPCGVVMDAEHIAAIEVDSVQNLLFPVGLKGVQALSAFLQLLVRGAKVVFERLLLLCRLIADIAKLTLGFFERLPELGFLLAGGWLRIGRCGLGWILDRFRRQEYAEGGEVFGIFRFGRETDGRVPQLGAG